MVLLCSCFGMRPKANMKEKQKQKQMLKSKLDQISRRDVASSSSSSLTSYDPYCFSHIYLWLHFAEI